MARNSRSKRRKTSALVSCSSLSTNNSQQDEPIFQSFSKLPNELQLKVWRFALPPPRIAKLTRSQEWGWEMLNVSGFNQSIESLKHTCRGSNFVARNYKLYKKIVWEGDPTTLSELRRRKGLWLNGELDTVFLDYHISQRALCNETYLRHWTQLNRFTPLTFPDTQGLFRSGILKDITNIVYGARLWLWWPIHYGMDIREFHRLRIQNAPRNVKVLEPPVVAFTECSFSRATKSRLVFNEQKKNLPAAAIFREGDATRVDWVQLSDYHDAQTGTILYLARNPQRPQHDRFKFVQETVDGGFFDIRDGTAWPKAT